MSKYTYPDVAVKVLEDLSALGFEANVVGGQLRVALHGGITNDVDIAILCAYEDIRHVGYALGGITPEHKTNWYSNQTGYLADFRVGDVNVVLYDAQVFDSIRMLVKSFDLSINQYYLDLDNNIKHDDFDGVHVQLTPYYGTARSVGKPPKPERVARFIREYPELDWAQVADETFAGVHDFEH